MTMQTWQRRQGFTVVELIIVIAVIAILATISIVSYNGVQARAKTSTSSAMSKLIIKKAEAVNLLTGHYPSDMSDFELNKETSLTGTGVVFSSVAFDGTQSANTILYSSCTPLTPTGAKIRSYDYTANAIVNTSIGTLVGPCTMLYGGPY